MFTIKIRIYYRLLTKKTKSCTTAASNGQEPITVMALSQASPLGTHLKTSSYCFVLASTALLFLELGLIASIYCFVRPNIKSLEESHLRWPPSGLKELQILIGRGLMVR